MKHREIEANGIVLHFDWTALTLLHFVCKRYKGFKSRHRDWV